MYSKHVEQWYVCTLESISAISYEDRNNVYTSFENCSCSLMDWFLTPWTFRITSLLNFNEYQCYHHLDLSMIKGFHSFVMFSLSLSNSVQQCQGNFIKDAGKRIFISWQTYEGLEISVN